MNIIKKIRRFVPYFPTLIMVGVLSIGPVLMLSTHIFGTTQTVSVSFHKRIKVKGQASYISSGGYYYVKGKRYTAQIGEELPNGTKFEIKVNPIIPREHNVMQVIEE